jgi:hypothetical protein
MKRSHLFPVLALLLAALFCQAWADSKAAPGKSPFDYPVVKTAAKAGEFVLCPPRLWIDQAFEKGADKQTFIYYTAVMAEPGAADSKVKTLPGKEETIPNSMIVPIKKGGKAKPGDVVLTWWQTGSGLQRAMIVKGGTETEPKAMYIDMDYENPSGCGKKVDTLKADSFCRLKLWDLGTAIAAKEKGTYKHGQLVGIAGDKVLLVGFAGRMFVAKKADCVPLPVMPPALKKGDTVTIPLFGGFTQGKVVKVDKAIGRVFVTYPFGGKEKTAAVAFGNVISKLP